MTIFEIDAAISAAIERAFAAVDTDTGEVAETFDSAKIEALQGERDAKIEGIALTIKNIDAEADAIDAEIKTLKKRLDAKRNRAQRLREFIAGYLHTAEMTRFETAKVALTFRRSKTVNVYDADALPDDFIKIVTEAKPDKVAIKAAIKAGATIPGAEIVENETLQIK